MQVEQVKKQGVIDSFTGLRGLAVLFVTLYHLYPLSVKGGYLGVVIFVTMSGYLVTDGFLTEFRKNKEIDVLGFYKRRATRLYPPLLFYMLLTTVWILFFQQEALQNYRGSFFSTLLGVNNWWQIGQNLSYFGQFARTDVYTHLWTLALEIQFYLIWPWILIGLARFWSKRLRPMLALTAVVGTVLSAILMLFLYVFNGNITRIYYGTDTRLFSFLFGALLAGLFNRSRLQKFYQMLPQPQARWIAWGIFAWNLLLLYVLPGDKALAYVGGIFIYNLSFVALLLVVAGESSPVGRFFANPVLLFLGERSYSYYLWQYTIMILTAIAFRGIQISYMATVWIQILLLILLGELTYQVMELRFSKYWQKMRKHKFDRQLLLRPSGIIAAVLTVLLLGSTLMALIQAPSGVGAEVLEMQKRLEENEKLNREMKSTEKVPAGSESGVSTPIVQSQVPTKVLKPAAVEGNQVFPAVVQQYPDLALTEEENALLEKTEIVALGDSVLAMTSGDMRKFFPTSVFEADKSRQFPAGLDILANMKKAGAIPPVIVYALGTNGVLNSSMLDQLAESYPDKKIFLLTIVTAREYEENVNALLKAAAEQHKNLYLIDWNQFAKTKTTLFYDDGTHPNLEGSPVYAQFVTKKILEGLNK